MFSLSRRRLAHLCVLAFSFWLVGGALHAQTAPVSPEDELKKKIKVTEDIQPLGDNPFGENVSLYNGALSFSQVDISIEGNGPSLLLSRSFHVPDTDPIHDYKPFLTSPLVDWSLDIPRIETLSAQDRWVDASGVSHNQWFFLENNQRCSSFSGAPTVNVSAPHGEPIVYHDYEWWHGYQLITPDGKSRDLLRRAPANTQSPQITLNGAAVNFPIVSKDHWMVGCLAQTSNGQPGEGFLAISPDGFKYWYDRLVYVDGSKIIHNAGGSLFRRRAMMLVSRIEDRFGNSLAYTYDSQNNLSSIQASDGRKIVLSYDVWQRPEKDEWGNYYEPPSARLRTVTLQPDSTSKRVWNYYYSADSHIPRLTSVKQPDGTSWSFDLGSMRSPALDQLIGYPNGCQSYGATSGISSTGTMVHPSGLSGLFTVKTVLRGRSYTPLVCVSGDDGFKTVIPSVYAVAAIISKRFSGSGIPDLVWTYSYSQPNASKQEDCASGCIDTVWTDVVDPSAHAIRYTFSNHYDASESSLLRTDYYSGAVGSTLMRYETNSYALPTGGPWPNKLGNTQQLYMNDAQLTTLSPLNQRVITQDGDTYTWQAEAFNAYAQVTKTKRFSSIAGQSAIEEQTDYLNNTAYWVLGLPLKLTNLGTGEVESENTYNANATLATRKRFGQPLMSYTFNAQGQLASFTDGNNHTTTLGSYKRGIPQAIGYPDGKSQSLVVDDFGQIGHITDQAGSTTDYSYDAVGRLTGITYPTGDEQAWYPKTLAYAYVTGAERGLAANHWRRTVSQGNARTVTYFDAELHPLLVDTYDATNSGSHSNVRTAYDWKGQTTFASYPQGGTPDLGSITAGTTRTYDALGRLTKSQQSAEAPFTTLTTTTAYLSGARQQVTDPKGNVTTSSYQVFDQPSYDAVIQVQAPAGITQAITRDVYGNPTAIRQYGSFNGLSGDLTKTLVYDSYHRLCRTTEPESGSEVLAYDAANNVAWSAAGLAITGAGCGQEQVAAAGRTQRTYDAMNRVLTLVPPSGTQSTTYAYDALGNPKSAVSGISTWTASRNKRGQLTGETLQLSGQGAWGIGYAHDAYGSLRQLTYPDGETVAYAPDALGRATRVGNYATGITYAPDGTVASFTYGNGATSYVEQNARHLLSNFTVGRSGTPDLSEDVAYDANGNITGITDQAGGPRTKSFGYDTLNRLTSATASGLWGSESYTYDPLNNLRTRVSGGSTFTYAYDALNRLGTITSGSSSVPFTYDNRGNVIGKNGVTLEFDQKNQLMDLPGHVTYAYDAAGRRVKKTPVSGNPTSYFYTQAGQLLYQVEADTAATNFIYLGTHLVARNATNLQAPPAAPALTVPASNATGSYTVSWTTAAGATYTLQEQVGGGAWAAAYSGNATSQAYSGKGNGTYGYRVQACNSAGCGAWSVVKSVAVLHPPAAPATITVPATSTGSIAVSWAASSTATSYTLQQRLGTGSWTAAYSGSATSTTRTVTASGSYTFQVQACNTGGCSAWKASTAVSVTVPPASAPTLTAPASSTSGSYTVSWTSVANATSYTLQEQVGGGAWGSIQGSSATSKAISGKGNGTYGYRVQACNAAGCGAWSATKNTVVTLIPAAPSTPSISTSGPSNKPVVHVNWGSVSTATSYQLEETHPEDGVSIVYNGPNASWSQLIYVNGTVKFRVKACNSAGCSAFSAYAAIPLLSGL